MTTLTHEQFAQHMDDMARHYRWASRSKAPMVEYALPHSVTSAAKRAGGLQAYSAPMQNWVNGMKSDSTDFSQDNQGRVTNASNRYTQTQNADAFDDDMDGTAKDGEQKATDNIEKWKEQGKELGHQNPQDQNAILQAFKAALGFFTGDVLGSITSFISNAVQTLVQWIQNAMASIGHFFGGVVNKIGNFFSHIF